MEYKEFKSCSAVWKYFLKSEDAQTAKCNSINKTTAHSTKGLHVHVKSKHNINLKAITVSLNTDLTKSEPQPCSK